MRATILIVLTALLLATLGDAGSATARAGETPPPEVVDLRTAAYVAPVEGIDLAEDLLDTRLAWFNPIDTGVGKTSGGGFLDSISRGATAPSYGGIADPIVADGKVFVHFTRSSGEAVAPRDSIQHRYYREKVKAKLPDSVFTIAADDVTACLDAETGELLWETVEKDTTLNFLTDKRGLNGMSGTYQDGVFYAMGLLGRVYAYNAADGKKLWEVKAEPWHAYAEKVKAKYIAEKKLPEMRDAPFTRIRYGMVTVKDLVIAPDVRGGLIGLDAKTGEERWRTPDLVMKNVVPELVTLSGKTYLLTLTYKGRNESPGTLVKLVDPANGKVLWETKSGYNPSTPPVGMAGGAPYVLLNTRIDPTREEQKKGMQKGEGLFAAYRVGLDGLEEAWRFEDKPEYIVRVKPDNGAFRKHAIRDGVLYMKMGSKKVKDYIRSFDLATGKELDVAKKRSGGAGGTPFLAEDKMYVSTDQGHSWSAVGLDVYQLQGKGEFEFIGQVRMPSFGVFAITGYQTPLETPYYKGRFYFRTAPGVAAIDMRYDPKAAFAMLQLDGAWAGYPKPLPVRLNFDDKGTILNGKVLTPTHSELGMVFGTARRNDSPDPITVLGPAQVQNGKLNTTLGFSFNAWHWPCQIEATFKDDTADGTWTRTIPGLAKPIEIEGKLQGRGGLTARVYHTPWLKDRPWTKLSDLPEGQRRIKLYLHDALPKGEQRKGFTIMLDYEGERVVAGVGGAYNYNQGWHEIDPSGLRVADGKLTGTMTVIVNPDPWMFPNTEAKSAMAGELTVDATLGEGEDAPMEGTFKATWGIPLTRTGPITGTAKNLD